MLARIETIEQFQSAISLMRAGHAALYVGLFMTLALVGLSAVSIWRKDERLAHAARRGQYALMLLTGLCCALLYVGIFNGYFFVNYIERVTEVNEEPLFKVAALWASQQGSLLFWCFILTLVGSAFAFSQRHNRTDRRLPYILAVIAVVQFFFFFIMTSPTDAEAAQRSSPFSMAYFWLGTPEMASLTIEQSLNNPALRAPRDGWDILRAMYAAGAGDVQLGQLQTLIRHDAASLPAGVQFVLLDQISDGNGMNPALHNYWLAIHPPMLYLGYVGFTIPFAYAVGSLLCGEVQDGWLRPIRLWTMAAWGFLTVGIAMGGLWAYEILGWGGYWAWDPVENASFIPWLTGTAFIHSVIVAERRGMLRMWSFALVIITYCMTILGTFLVRTGIISSVHAFGATGDVDTWFYMFIALVFIGPLLLIVWRAPLLRPDRKLDSLVSREGSFLFNNLIFLAIALVTLVMTFWPWITERLYGEGGSEELGQDAYVMINVPLFLMLLLLMGIGPTLAWQRNSLRHMLRAFTPAALAALAVGVINAVWLASSDLLIDTDRGDRIATLAAWVRLMIQLTLWPICAFTFVCIATEFVNGAKARARAAREKLPVAMARLTLKNRRRYGGYIVHLGVLLIALGIYYSSMYESEGSIVAREGGHAILDDALTGKEFLIVFEHGEGTPSWDRLRDAFGRDEQRAALYENMLRFVRANPDQSAAELIEQQRRDFRQNAPPELTQQQIENALGRMIGAITWAVSLRDSAPVYEQYDSTLRTFAYRRPAELDTAAYLEAHGRVRDFLRPLPAVQSEDDAARVLARLLVRDVINFDSTRLSANLAEARRSYQEAGAADFISFTGISDHVENVSDEAANRIRERMDEVLDGFTHDLHELATTGVTLAAEQGRVHRELRRKLSRLDAAEFAQAFGLDAGAADFPTRRFRALQELEEFHKAIEMTTTKRRNEIATGLALRLPDESAAETLRAMRPLSLTGLGRALEVAEDEATREAIAAEQREILRGARTLRPHMRIFYDKRSGAPKMDEPLKDPQYHRTLSRDLYFILQDVRPDGTATFRFFIKPHMVLGLTGLLVLVLGTVLAFLPALPRRSKF